MRLSIHEDDPGYGQYLLLLEHVPGHGAIRVTLDGREVNATTADEERGEVHYYGDWPRSSAITCAWGVVKIEVVVFDE